MIRIIAWATMLLDHIGYVFYPDIQFFRVIGRLSYPLFAWGIAKGYRYTEDIKSYAVRLLVIAMVSQLPYFLLFRNGYLNVCFTLFCGLVLLHFLSSKYNLLFKLFITVLGFAVSELLQMEYGAYGMASIMVFYLFWDDIKSIYYYGLLTLISILIFRYDPMQIIAALSPVIILFLGKTEYKISKVLRYSFYPLHLIILLVIQSRG